MFFFHLSAKLYLFIFSNQIQKETSENVEEVIVSFLKLNMVQAGYEANCF